MADDWEGMSGMVESVEISRVNIRDTLSLDLSVWMNHPDDMDFRPSLSCKDKTITISSISSGEALASVELDDEQMQALEASLTAELRVKFQFMECTAVSTKSPRSSLTEKRRNSLRRTGKPYNR